MNILVFLRSNSVRQTIFPMRLLHGKLLFGFYCWAFFGGIIFFPPIQAQVPIKTMTFNVRYDNTMDSLNPWRVRKDWVVELLEEYDADIVGLQEVLHEQMIFLEEELPQYEWVGIGRDDGKTKGEYIPILYKKDRFDLLNHSHFWLSKTPQIAGSKSWRALPRMVTWVELEDKKNGEIFFVFNTHFDHFSRKARRKSADLLLESVKNIGGEIFSLVLGDFNALPHTQPYLQLASNLKDTHHLSENTERGSIFTFHSFGSTNPKLYRMIDYVFISDEQKMRVLQHSILTDNWQGKYPSDHFPVLAIMEWK